MNVQDYCSVAFCLEELTRKIRGGECIVSSFSLNITDNSIKVNNLDDEPDTVKKDGTVTIEIVFKECGSG